MGVEGSESSNSDSSSESGISEESSPRSPRKRRYHRTRGGRRSPENSSRGLDEEEEDEEALIREAQGYVGFRDGLIFYRTYTATELIDSETKQKGRKTEVHVGDFVDLMVARDKTKNRSILYRFGRGKRRL